MLSKTKVVRGILVIAVTVLALNGEKAAADVYLGFGDSITQGTPYVDDEGNGRRVGGYEPELEQILGAMGIGSYVYNWGVGGENTYDGFDRLPVVLARNPEADYILLLEGTNDYSIYSVETTEDFLGAMVDLIIDSGLIPVLATLPPDTGHGGEKQYAVATQYNPMIRELAIEKGVILADMYAAMVDGWKSLMADGTHPNSQGYEVMARVWADAVTSPYARTKDALSVNDDSASLNGAIQPNHNQATYHFQYGESAQYGMQTEAYDLDTTTGEATVSIAVSELNPDTVYYYRLVVNDGGGTYFGGSKTFDTGSGSNSDSGSSDSNGGSSGGCFISILGDYR